VRHIAWAADEDGYTVRLLEGTETLEEYNAGNNPLESSSWVNPATNQAESVETLRKFAEQTAIEMAIEAGLTESDVSENTDLLPIRGN
jgi:hypothetical protein